MTSIFGSRQVFVTRIALVLAVLPSAASSQTLAIRAQRVLTGTGQEILNGVIMIEDGKIKSVGPETPIQNGVPVVDYLDSTICPGFVEPHSALGVTESGDEIAHAVEPNARAADFYDPAHRQFREALASGITTAALAAGSMDVVGGLGIVVKTAGERDTIVRDGAFLKMSVTRDALSDSRVPTSPIGLMHVLRGELSKAQAATDSSPLHALVTGKLRALIDARSPGEIAQALEITAAYHLDVALVHADDGARVADDLKSAKVPAILGPYTFDTPKRLLLTPAALSKAGTPVAFTSDAPLYSPEFLRMTAALAVRHGLPLDEALRALTSVPAQILGVSDRVGSVATGRDADLCVWSGHPVDLRSRLQAAYIKGTRVFRQQAGE